MPTYLKLSSACPALQVAPAYLSIAAATPSTASTITAGSSGAGSLSTPFNRNAVRLDANAGAGGNGSIFAVRSGLDLQVNGSGLTETVTAGQAMMPGAVPTTPAAVSAAATNSIATVYVWMAANGALTFVNNSAATQAGKLFLGTFSTNDPAGQIQDLDYSGRPVLAGSIVKVQTADVGIPGQLGGANPDGLIFLHETVTGLYLWDGDAYVSLAEGMPVIPESVTGGKAMVVPAGYQQTVRGAFACTGTGSQLIVAGRFYVTG